SFLNYSCILIKSGVAFKHGKHPRYQKSNKTILPFKSLNLMILPLLRCKSVVKKSALFVFVCAEISTKVKQHITIKQLKNLFIIKIDIFAFRQNILLV